MRRILAHLILALAVGLLAPAGYAHALSHLDGGRAQKQKSGDANPQAGHPCELCAAYSATGSGGAAPSSARPIDFLRGPAPHRPTEPSLPALALTRFLSRAPPSAS